MQCAFMRKWSRCFDSSLHWWYAKYGAAVSSIVEIGGGFFRLMPYRFISRWTKQCSNYCLSYIHPRAIDACQPMLEGLPLLVNSRVMSD